MEEFLSALSLLAFVLHETCDAAHALIQGKVSFVVYHACVLLFISKHSLTIVFSFYTVYHPRI